MTTEKTSERILAWGTLGDDGDTWFLMTERGTLLIDAPFLLDSALEGRVVSVLGRMGVPSGAPFRKLMAEKIVSHADIALRAYALHQAGAAGTALDDWLRAERELAGV